MEKRTELECGGIINMGQNSDEQEWELEKHVSPHLKAFEAISPDNPSSVKLSRHACMSVRTPKKMPVMKTFISSTILRIVHYSSIGGILAGEIGGSVSLTQIQVECGLRPQTHIYM
jgi:hypothetical protein